MRRSNLLGLSPRIRLALRLPIALAVRVSSPAERRVHRRMRGPFDAVRIGLLDFKLRIDDLSAGGCLVEFASGFLLSTTVFLALSDQLRDEQFFAFGWRIPFLASAVLVLVGLYVRLTIAETPVFTASLHRRERVKVPMLVVLRDYPGTLVVGTLVSLATFVIFYVMTVFTLAQIVKATRLLRW